MFRSLNLYHIKTLCNNLMFLFDLLWEKQKKKRIFVADVRTEKKIVQMMTDHYKLMNLCVTPLPRENWAMCQNRTATVPRMLSLFLSLSLSVAVLSTLANGVHLRRMREASTAQKRNTVYACTMHSEHGAHFDWLTANGEFAVRFTSHSA